MPKYLSNSALKAINRIGDIIIPAYEQFPSFSQAGGVVWADGLLECAPEADRKDLNLLLTILAFMPTFILRWLVGKMETSPDNSGMLGPIYRQLDVGIRGIVFSCYYSGRLGAEYKGADPLDTIGFELTRIED